MKRVGVPIVISAASGTGKTSLCMQLLKTLSGVARSISYTTRPPRGVEKHGIDYYFIDDDEFDRMVQEGEFIEFAEVHGKRYGTGISAVQEQLKGGVDVLLDIDVQGGVQIRDKLNGAIMIFLLPPSMDELTRRLQHRATDAPEVVKRRLAQAKDEIRQSEAYDYLVVNDDFDQAAEELRAIIRAHRLRENRRNQLVEALLSDR